MTPSARTGSPGPSCAAATESKYVLGLCGGQHEGTFAAATCRCFRRGPLSVRKVQAGAKGPRLASRAWPRRPFLETHPEARDRCPQHLCCARMVTVRRARGRPRVCETPVLPKDSPRAAASVPRGACACACACATASWGSGEELQGSECEIGAGRRTAVALDALGGADPRPETRGLVAAAVPSGKGGEGRSGRVRGCPCRRVRPRVRPQARGGSRFRAHPPLWPRAGVRRTECAAASRWRRLDRVRPTGASRAF